MTISDWLKKLGMSEYAQRFAANDIDFSVLPELTDQDLRELVARFTQIEGYRCLSLTRAVGVVKCQLALAWRALR